MDKYFVHAIEQICNKRHFHCSSQGYTGGELGPFCAIIVKSSKSWVDVCIYGMMQKRKSHPCVKWAMPAEQQLWWLVWCPRELYHQHMTCVCVCVSMCVCVCACACACVCVFACASEWICVGAVCVCVCVLARCILLSERECDFY